MRQPVLALWLLLLLALAPQVAGARPRVQPYVVDVQGLGPMLLVGASPSGAVTGYVSGLERRGIFATLAPRLRSWGEALSRGQAHPVSALRRSGRPVIGIQLNLAGSLLGEPEGNWGARAVARAVRRAGGEPVFLPPGESPSHIDRLLGEVDHLILSGGADVHPSLYRRAVTHSVGIDLERDRYERRLLSRALHCGLGVDGICRGAQLLNVTLGGTLHQDLLLDGATRVAHRPRQGATLRHAISLEGSSATASVVGCTILRELTAHHQAASRVAPGLRVTGRTPDGIVEVLESPGGQARGYQFHPEAPRSQAGRAIFRDLVRRAREHASRR